MYYFNANFATLKAKFLSQIKVENVHIKVKIVYFIVPFPATLTKVRNAQPTHSITLSQVLCFFSKFEATRR